MCIYGKSRKFYDSISTINVPIQQIFIEILTTLLQAMDKWQDIITLVKQENTTLCKHNDSNFLIKQKCMFQADTSLCKWNKNTPIKSNILKQILIG